MTEVLKIICPNNSSVVRRAPGKINLALHITGKREDSFHNLESIVVFTRFSDRITVSRSTKSTKSELSICGPYATEMPDPQINLVWKAYQALKANPLGKNFFPLSILLEKRLPVESGIGGGSSDAAATLDALNFMWKLYQDNSPLYAIAESLGADVPMCLMACPLLVQGKGEILKPVKRFPKLHIVLINSGNRLSTPHVFSVRKAENGSPLPVFPSSWTFSSLVSWLQMCRNDLLEAACVIAPSIQGVLSALYFHGAAFSSMSGSGATCFGLFSTEEKAKSAAKIIKKERPNWFVVATRTNHTASR